MSEWKTRITKVQVVKPRVDSGEACLVLVYPPGPDMGKRFPLSRNEVVLGRGSDCDIQVDRDSVSRRHARVFRNAEQWTVEDLGSTNGSYVNDVPVQRSPLRDSDFLKIGAAIFKFLSGAGVEAAYHEEIYRMTIIDGLTGAHNKRSFLEFLEREIARCARHRRPLSLLMFDIDHFKAINDRHGHAAGDAVLEAFARALEKHLPSAALRARIGGEEFLALWCAEDVAQAAAELAALRLATAPGCDLHRWPPAVQGVRFSGGTALRQGGEDVDAWYRRADHALYRAKAEGRDRVLEG